MKAILTAAFLFLSGSLALANVTKEDVKKLLNAGISDATIVVYIHQNAPAMPLSADDIAGLKAAGAGDAVLKALQDAAGSSGYSPSSYSYPYYPYYYYPYSYYYPYYPSYPVATFSFGFGHSHVHHDGHVHHPPIHHSSPHPVTAPHPMHTSPHGGGGFHGHH